MAGPPPRSPEEQAWWARAWARHPLVVMARHRSRRTFFQGLHRMIQAGIALPVAFAELSRGAQTDPFARAVAQVGRDVDAGSGLAEAMRRQSRWFEPQAVALLGAAEATGTLESALARLLEQMEEAQAMRWRVVARCAYPGYLLAAFVFAGSLLDTAASLMAGAGGVDALVPVFVGHFVRKVLLVSGGALALFLAPLVLALPALESPWERVRMALPVLGRVHRELQASRFSLVLGVALGAGLEVGQSLQMALESTGSGLLRARARLALHRLQSGASLTDVVEWLGVLDRESLQRVSIGERTGNLDSTFAQLSREHADRAMRWLGTLMIGLVVLLSVVLFATNLDKLVHLQEGYQRQLEGLGKE